MTTDKITLTQSKNRVEKHKKFFGLVTTETSEPYYRITSERLGQLACGGNLDEVIKLAKKNYRVYVPDVDAGDVYWSGTDQCFLVRRGFDFQKMSRGELAELLYRLGRDQYAKFIPEHPLLPPFELSNA